MRIAIVGGGPSGLAALRALTNAGFDAIAFEKGARIGGVWTLEDRDTAAYRSLHLITSRARTEFEEFPMPEGTPDYPRRDQVGEYIEAYAREFGLTDRVRVNAEVVAARRPAEGDGAQSGWKVELASGERETFDLLVVANGHNEVPSWPNPPYPGDFAGRQLHALEYDDPEELRNKKVMVVGMGNSAMDIVTDSSYVAEKTYLSTRHGSWVIPKRLLGQPADQVVRPWVAVNIPWWIRQPISEALLRITVGPPEKYGLPKPEGGLFQSHPTITDTVLSRISHGEITPKPGIEHFETNKVRFTDGTTEAVDTIVWCTGYRVVIPFLDESIVGPDPKTLPLYKRILHLEHDDLFFIGLMQSTGSAFPIVERQSQLLAEHLAGRWAPPSRSEMRAECDARRKRALKRWGPHGRPDMRVDFDMYMHELAKEIEAGRERARASGAGQPAAAPPPASAKAA